MIKYILSFILILFFSFLGNSQTYIQGNGLVEVPQSTATAGATTTLTNASQTVQVFTGTLAQNVKLPSGTTLQKGHRFEFYNDSTQTITIQYNDASTALSMPTLTRASFRIIDNSTTNGLWDIFGPNSKDLTLGTTNGLSLSNQQLSLSPLLTYLGDVSITSPVVNNVLSYNGINWINSPVANTSAGQGVILFLDDTATIDGYGSLLQTPNTAIPTVTDNVSVPLNSTVFGEGYLYQTALQTTTISAGVWEYDFYDQVSSLTGTCGLGFDNFNVITEPGTITITGSGTSRTATASTGTIFVSGDANANQRLSAYLQTPGGTFQITGFTSSTVVTIATLVGYVNETAVTYYKHNYLFGVTSADIQSTSPILTNTFSVQPAFAINATDTLALRVYGVCTAGGTKTVTWFHNGTTLYSHYHTPLAQFHNDLAGLQGGSSTERYHLTAAQAAIAAVTTGTNSGDVTLTAVGASPSANAATLSGQALTLQPADNTHPGVVTTTTQVFAGDKQFNGTVTLSQQLFLNGGISYTPTVNSTLTGSNADISTHATDYFILTNASLVSIASINNQTIATGHEVRISNQTGNSITIVNNYATPPGTSAAILTPGGTNFLIPDKGFVSFLYNTNGGNSWVLDMANRITNLASNQVTGILPNANTTATSANTANAIVARDASGNITVGTVSGALSGNATTATTSTNIAGGAGGSLPYQSAANTTAMLANGTAGQFLMSNGTTLAPSWSASTGGAIASTVQRFTSGSGTYTTPANVYQIRVRMVGGGGGGGGSATGGSPSAGGGGGATTFGSSLLTANGGAGGTHGTGGGGGQFGAGGTATINSPAIGSTFIGGGGGSGSNQITVLAAGGNGGNSIFGGGGSGGTAVALSPSAGATNTGGGGGGAGAASGASSGGGGGAGGGIDATIQSPSATYSYSVGTAGSAGGGGTGTGGAGGSLGYIEVTEYYANGAIGTATSLTGGSGGSIPYQSASSTTAMLANGAGTQVLQSQGSTSAPVWQYPNGNYVDKAASYTLVASTNDVVDFTAVATATLPTAVGITGKKFTIINSSTAIITVSTTSSQTINGVVGSSLNSQYETLIVQSDGANWYILNRTYPQIWVAYTPTFTGFGTPTSVNFYSRRIGDSLEVQGYFTAGTVTATAAAITIGYNGVNAGITIASSKPNGVVGFANSSVSSSSNFGWGVLAGAGNNFINIGQQTSTAAITAGAANANAIVLSNGIFEVNFTVPITGWN